MLGSRCYYNKTLLKNSHNKGNLKMKRFNPETKTFKVFTALYNGAALTASKAKLKSVLVSRTWPQKPAVSANQATLFIQTAVQLATV